MATPDSDDIQTVTHIDGATVPVLLKDFGSPLFVFSERSLRERLAHARNAFTAHCPRFHFAWSYKTNHLDAICGIFHQEGWGAEVVSGLEYEMARRRGIAGSKIILNGPHKSRALCTRALSDGAFVQIDHPDELRLLAEIARSLGRRFPVGIRVNMKLNAVDPSLIHNESLGSGWDRFGFNLESGAALEAAEKVIQSENLELGGLHAHVGTFITAPEVYVEVVQRLGGLANAIAERTGKRVTRINLGGGLPSDRALLTGVNAADRDIVDLEPFAVAIGAEMKRSFTSFSPLPEVNLESGRALIDNAGTLLATVIGIREMHDGQQGVIVDAGLNIMGTARRFLHPVLPTQPPRGPNRPSAVLGPLAMDLDWLRRNIPLPPLVAGDHVAIRPVGAYNTAHWNQFTQLRPAIVIVDMDGRAHLLRRAETIDDVKGPEQLPARYTI